MTTQYAELIKCLDTKLAEFGYAGDSQISIPNIKYIAYIKNVNVFKVKNLCAVIDMPDNIVDSMTAKRFFTFLKSSLLDQYGEAFLWKELEMCFVVLCRDKLYGILKNSEGKVMSQASFSLNAMMGTFFINKDTLDHFAESTWGLYFSGDHFRAVHKVVGEWCGHQKSAPQS